MPSRALWFTVTLQAELKSLLSGFVLLVLWDDFRKEKVIVTSLLS